MAGHQLDDADQARLADEETSERLRLLYVALTRAEEQLNIYAACCDGTPDNTFAYLLEGRADGSRWETQKAYLHRKSGKGGKTALMQMLEDNWRQFVAHAPDNTDFAFADKAPAEAASQSRRGSGITYRAAVIPERSFDIVRHTSFTGLSRHVKTRDDEREELQPALDPAENIERPSENIVSDGLTDAEDIHHFRAAPMPVFACTKYWKNSTSPSPSPNKPKRCGKASPATASNPDGSLPSIPCWTAAVSPR